MNKTVFSIKPISDCMEGIAYSRDYAICFTDKHGEPQQVDFFATLEVEGFDDDGICEIFYDFTDEDEPKPLTKENMIEAIEEWGLIEELGLEEYQDNSNLMDILCDFLMAKYKAIYEDDEE